MNAIGFLQNAWSPYYAGRTWPRHFWLQALMRSRTGQKLKIIMNECPDLDIRWDETTPIVGPTSSSVVPPDLEHIYRVLSEHPHDLVLMFGRQAERAVVPFVLSTCPYVVAPHPASRIVTNELYRQLGTYIRAGEFNRGVEFTQGKGFVCRIKHEFHYSAVG